jgi:cob(I)alamin adenosyltransferase
MTSPRVPERHGLLIVHTGDGKGKTTAALGMALRAIGHGMKVLVVQFIKAEETGEVRAAERLAPELTIRVMGRGFVFGEWTDEDRQAARDAWDFARSAIASGEYGMVILDEINYVLAERVIEPAVALEAIVARPAGVHVILTGRKAPPEVVKAADLVTEMLAIKHPFEQGIGAQKGIEV